MKFVKMSKNRNIWYRGMYHNRCTKLQADIFFIVKLPKKQVKVMTSHFWKLDFFAFLIEVRKTSGDKTGQERHVFKSKFWFSRSGLFLLNLTWLGQMRKWMSPSRFASQMSRKFCHTTLMLYFHMVTSFELALILTCA